MRGLSQSRASSCLRPFCSRRRLSLLKATAEGDMTMRHGTCALAVLCFLTIACHSKTAPNTPEPAPPPPIASAQQPTPPSQSPPPPPPPAAMAPAEQSADGVARKVFLGGVAGG